MSKLTSTDIAQQLLDGITSGRLAVGSLLPTEFELCEQFHASRYTIRAALQELQDKGLVSRRKNVGTRVESSRAKAVFRPTLASVEDLVHFGEAHVRSVKSVKKVSISEAVARDTGWQAGTQKLRISSIRTQSGEDARPIAWTDVYIDPAYTDIGGMVRKSPETLVSSLIEMHYGRVIAEIQQDIFASTVHDPVIADALQLTCGSAVLKIIRRYIDEVGEAFEVSVTLHPADSFSVSMQLRRP